LTHLVEAPCLQPHPFVAILLDQALGVADGAMAHQWRRVIEQDDVDLVGAQSPPRLGGKFQLKIEAATGIENGVMPDRDVHVR
jgi:hypothetical protein